MQSKCASPLANYTPVTLITSVAYFYTCSTDIKKNDMKRNKILKFIKDR